MKTIRYPDMDNLPDLLKRPSVDEYELERKVSELISEIRRNGDSAVREYSLAFDGIKLDTFFISEEELKEAESICSDELKEAIGIAKKNIEKFHLAQKTSEEEVETAPGVKCWRKAIGIEKVGLYIPGGTAALFSTVLMLGVPANLAGCREIVLCTPPDKNGNANAAILYTANLLGIKKIFKIGGAQAIAAMGFGTETVPKVDKIFGPGNQFVTSAKKLVNRLGVAIDMPAGPSELLIMADNTCVPAFVAADLLSQAEHGTDSQVILVTMSEEVIRDVKVEIKRQLEQLPRKTIAEKALENSKIFLVKNEKQAMALSNEYAPEHLIIVCENSETLSKEVINAGSVFIGNYSCESAGDYASGTNHTLPTSGFAKTESGVSFDSFVKKVTFQKIDKKGIESIGKCIEIMAEAEGLIGHKNAVSIRLKEKECLV